MNFKDINWIVDSVSNFIIDTRNEKNGKNYRFLAYSNNTTNLAVIRFQIEDDPFDHVVFDYVEEKKREDCYGINVYDASIRLNCDLIRLKEIGYIDYILNNELSEKLNQTLSPIKM